MNSKSKGSIAVAKALNYYILNQVDVCIPFTDNKPYDLVKDVDGELFKIQCKYTNAKNPYERFYVDLRITGGNQSFHTSKKYKNGDFDFLFVCTSDFILYEIPYKEINDKGSIVLGEKYKKYKLN